MRYSVAPTPRRLARLARHSPVLLRVVSGSVRISDQQEALYNGEGITIAATDGTQNWIMPEGEVWICSDSGSSATVEVFLP